MSPRPGEPYTQLEGDEEAAEIETSEEQGDSGSLTVEEMVNT